MTSQGKSNELTREHDASSILEDRSFVPSGIKKHRSLFTEGLIGKVLVIDDTDDVSYYVDLEELTKLWKFHLGITDRELLEKVLLRLGAGEEIVCDYDNKIFMRKGVKNTSMDAMIIEDINQFKEDINGVDSISVKRYLQNKF